MPIYAYQCDNCNNRHEESRSIKEPHPKNCPHCGQKFDESTFYQDFSQHKTSFTGMEATTVGQQAERNSKKLGKELIQLKEEQKATKYHGWKGKLPDGAKIAKRPKKQEKLPFWRSGEIEGLPRREKCPDLKTAVAEAKKAGIEFKEKKSE